MVYKLSGEGLQGLDPESLHLCDEICKVMLIKPSLEARKWILAKGENGFMPEYVRKAYDTRNGKSIEICQANAKHPITITNPYCFVCWQPIKQQTVEPLPILPLTPKGTVGTQTGEERKGNE